jgi:uncharacterized repeat protein (TIGR01451 family)
MIWSSECRSADADGRRRRFAVRSLQVMAVAGGSLLLAATVATAASVAPASGVTIGEAFVPRVTADTSDLTLLQKGFFGPGSPYAVPFDGVLTSWSVRAASIPTQFAFKVGRPAPEVASDGTGDFTIVASSALLTLVPDQLNTHNASIPVQAGDVLGGYQPAPYGLFGDPAPGSSEQAVSTNGDAPTGSKAHYDYEVIDARVHTSPSAGGLKVPISAYVEPDTDGDASADVSQDRCPARFGTAQGCPVADLAVSQTANPASVTQGRAVVYQLVVTNHGPDPVSGATVSDPLPAGASLLSATPSVGTCSLAPDLRCDLGALPSGQSATVKLVVQADAAGPLTMTARVATPAVPPAIGAGDPNPANDSATLTTDVQTESQAPAGPQGPAGVPSPGPGQSVLPPGPGPSVLPPGPGPGTTPPPFRGVLFGLHGHTISATKGAVRISLRSTVAARGTLKLTTVLPRHKTAILGQASFALAANRPKTVTLRLTRLGLALARASDHPRRVIAVATAGAGNETKTTKASATLKLARTHR